MRYCHIYDKKEKQNSKKDTIMGKKSKLTSQNYEKKDKIIR